MIIFDEAGESSQRGVWIFYLLSNQGGVLFNGGFREGCKQLIAQQLAQAQRPGGDAAVLRAMRGVDLMDDCEQIFDALAISRNDAANGCDVGAADVVRDALHGAEILFQPFRAGEIGFVDGEDVGDFHDAGFDGLHIVAHARDEDDDGDISEAGDFDFVLTDADGFDEDVVAAGGIEQERQFESAAREAAEFAAARHGADEDAGVGVMLLHADAVAEDGAVGERAGGIDGDDADGAGLAAEVGGDLIDKGAFAGAGRAGDAENEGAASVGEQGGDELAGGWCLVFDGGGGAGEGTGVAGEDAVEEGGG